MYIRKVKKGSKTYFYYYKSERIGNKVKSIYVGRALEKVKKPVKKFEDIKVKTTKEVREVKKFKQDNIVNNLLEFDNLLNEINNLMINKDLNEAIFTYNKMFELYKNMNIDHEDKARVFEKLNNVYNNLIELSKEHKINLE